MQIFHHVYAIVETTTNKIEELRYFPTSKEAEIVAKRTSTTCIPVLCDNFDCKVGDYVLNGRVYREDATGNLTIIKKQNISSYEDYINKLENEIIYLKNKLKEFDYE